MWGERKRLAATSWDIIGLETKLDTLCHCKCIEECAGHYVESSKDLLKSETTESDRVPTLFQKFQ